MSETTKATEEPIKIHKFNDGSVLSVILKVAVPIVLLMMFNSAYAFVDSLMSSNFVYYGSIDGVTKLTGGTSIGLIFPMMGILNSFQVMHSAGGGLAYTKNLAQKDYEGAKKTFGQTFSLSWTLGVIIIIFTAIIGIPYILTASGNWNGNTWGEFTKPMVMDGYEYMVILTFAFIPMTLQGSYMRILRSEGKGFIAAIIPGLTMPINIGFDYLFMKVLKIGLIGAGLATLIATTSGALMMMSYVFYIKRKETINISYKFNDLRIKKEYLIIVLIFGLGSFYRRIFDGINTVIVSNYVGNIFLDDPSRIPIWTGSWTMMTRSINMGTMMALGFGQSMAMLISFYNNSNQKEKVKNTVKTGSICIFIVQLIAIVILLLAAKPLFHAYGITEFEGYGGELGKSYIMILLFSIPMSLQIIPALFYSGMKDPKSTLFHTLIFNASNIVIVTIFFLIEHSTKKPLMLFTGIFVGGMIGLMGTGVFFNKRYRQLLSI